MVQLCRVWAESRVSGGRHRRLGPTLLVPGGELQATATNRKIILSPNGCPQHRPRDPPRGPTRSLPARAANSTAYRKLLH